jgi:hypothetical protein
MDKMKTQNWNQKISKLGIMVAMVVVSGAINAQTIRATVDGNAVPFLDVQPMMMNNRVMVPVRGVFEHLNADVMWSAANRTVTAQRGSDQITLPINSNLATVNGREVRLESPAMMSGGRVMVPLRFLSEALSAQVDWLSSSRTVAIVTSNAYTVNAPMAGYTMRRLDIGTVIPFNLIQKLGSGFSKKGDLFDAKLETSGLYSYEGLPMGSILQGHIDTAIPRDGETPGVLGLTFDQVKLPDGKAYKIFGSLISMDDKSTKIVEGRYIAKPGVKSDNLKYIGYGAGAGLLVSLLTEGRNLESTLIGSAIGLLFAQTQKDPKQVRDVVLESGSTVGVRLDREFTFHILNSQNR